MSELNELIASEIADFFAGFGGPGEPDIQSGEAQRLLTERVLSVLALRERAEPVAWRHDDGPFALGVLTRSKSVAENWAAKGWKITPLYTAPPAPVVPTFDEWLEIRGNKPLGWVKDAMRESYDACRAAMLAAPRQRRVRRGDEPLND
ncbi:hypothetical protein [Cronobacter sakazakii]|uniref:hypothetical protein n=1 Tax=Cronobacter sakazakii TaxID=28141 RepID=UPI000948FCFC|nr:hypothetical protein [Cronobacter sakazakii]EMC4369453.1 hypothetical protein [Cronobacter sakazakii]